MHFVLVCLESMFGRRTLRSFVWTARTSFMKMNMPLPKQSDCNKSNFTPFLHKIHFFINMMAFSPRILNYFFRTLLKSKLWILVFKDSNFPKKLIFVGGDRHHVTKKTSDFPGTGEAMGVPPGRAALSYMMSGTPNGNAKQKHTSGGLWTGFGFGHGTRHEINLRWFCFFAF